MPKSSSEWNKLNRGNIMSTKIERATVAALTGTESADWVLVDKGYSAGQWFKHADGRAARVISVGEASHVFIAPKLDKALQFTFIQASKTFYAATFVPDGRLVDELLVVVESADESLGELFLEWVRVSSEPCLHLRAFGESMRALQAISPVLDVLAAWRQADATHEPSIDEVRALLEFSGFEDVTPTKRPQHRSNMETQAGA